MPHRSDSSPAPRLVDQALAAGPRPSDMPLVELLRTSGPRGVGALATELGVTPTAVRQRLERLLQAGLVVRALAPLAEAGAPPAGAGGAACAAAPSTPRTRRSRGRPAHVFSLSDKGRRTGGENFRDLALVLWHEIRAIADTEVRRGLLGRIGTALAEMVEHEVTGTSPVDRLEGTAELLRRRRVSAEFFAGDLPVLISHSCPYPDLAECDRGICAAERVMIQHLVGAPVQLTECRLDGGTCCRFSLADTAATGSAAAQ